MLLCDKCCVVAFVHFICVDWLVGTLSSNSNPCPLMNPCPLINPSVLCTTVRAAGSAINKLAVDLSARVLGQGREGHP